MKSALLLICFFSISLCAVSTEDKESLIEFYNTLGGPSWTNNDGWTVGDPCDNNWYGITCSSGDIYSINLYSNNVVGTIPSTLSISSLKTL